MPPSRRRGARVANPARWRRRRWRTCASPGFDGSGAASVFALVRTGKRYAVASLLFKLGHGVRDAWVHRDLTRIEARAQLDRVAGEIDLVPVSPATLKRLLAHALSLNVEGVPPPFGTLDAVEVLGLGTINPETATPEDLVAAALGEARRRGRARRRARHGRRLAGALRLHGKLVRGRWPPSTRRLLGRKGLSKARKVDLVLQAVVAPRRRRWGEMLAWMALITADADAREEATGFALVAAALLGDRAAAEVPLLRAIAEGTVEARRLRRG